MIVPSMGRGPLPSYLKPYGVDVLTHLCCPQQPLFLSFGVVFLVQWASVDIVYNGFGGGWNPGGSRVVISGSISTSGI